MGGCCTINRNPIHSIVQINNLQINDKNALIIQHEGLTQKTSMFLIEKLIQDTVQMDKIKLINYGNFVKRRNGSIQVDFKFDQKPLGKGAFGEVYKAMDKKTKLKRAVKIIKKKEMNQGQQSQFIGEVDILKKLDHPNIMKIIEFYEDDICFYLVSELYTGGELFRRVIQETSLNENEAAEIMRQIFSAVSYLHKNQVVHRDLKPENIVYLDEKSDLIKIIDFGTSKIFQEKENMHQKFGTLNYVAPEVLKGCYTEKCDIWSCGIILYILLCGYPPFKAKNIESLISLIEKGNYGFDSLEWNQVSNEAKSLISRMLIYNPKLRPSAEECLNDLWLKKTLIPLECGKEKLEKALINLKNFRVKNGLQHAVLAFIVSILTTNEEKLKLIQIFNNLDQDGDGLITNEDLKIGFYKIFNLEKNNDEIQQILGAIDSNGNGSINYMEFLTVTFNRKLLLSKSRLEAAFKMLDSDGDGFLSLEELSSLMKNFENHQTYLEKMFETFDTNGDKQLENENQLHIKPKPGESKKFDLQLEEPEMNHSLSIKNNNDLGKIESPLNNESSEFENSQENSKEINDIYCNQLKSETQLKQNEEYNSNN